MTRLPSDSFLPSGAVDAELQLSLAGLASNPSSVVSPLSLPGGVHYFDSSARPSVTSYPTQSPYLHRGGSRDPPRAQPASFLSPHLTPIPSHSQYRLQMQQKSPQRASSLSPTREPLGRRRDGALDSTMDAEYDLSHRVTSPGVSIPVDTISGTGSGLITIRRPAVRVNPTVDSTSGDSQSTEQDYRRLERMRQAFDDERRYLQANRDRAEEVYKEMVDELEQDHARQRAQWETDKYKLQTQVMQLQNRLKEVESRGNGTTADPRLATFHSGPSSHSSPFGQPSLSPSASCDRNSLDALLATEHQGPTKVIDVQEYHKDLEGIHLKENFVKMETFTDTPSSAGSRESSAGVSPPPQVFECPKSLARARSIRALRADASSRLTMHAGHTPTVSLSIAHTEVTNTVVSSGSNTPTLTGGDGALSSDSNDRRESTEPAEPVSTAIDHEPAIMEPSDEDHELKGPLTLRNMPAKDEAFLKRLSDKLEKVTSGEDATPTVLKHSVDEDEDDVDSNTQKTDASAKDTEDHIELCIRKTSTNFGKPFGVA